MMFLLERERALNKALDYFTVPVCFLFILLMLLTFEVTEMKKTHCFRLHL